MVYPLKEVERAAGDAQQGRVEGKEPPILFGAFGS
jgi:hypothetical protein